MQIVILDMKVSYSIKSYSSNESYGVMEYQIIHFDISKIQERMPFGTGKTFKNTGYNFFTFMSVMLLARSVH